MKRRGAIAAGFAALLPLSSGCLGVITGSKPASFEASPVSIGDDALAETGYESTGTETRTVERTVTALGQDRTVEITNHVATAERRATLGPLGERTVGAFAAASTPAVEIAGETHNPLAEYDGGELIRRFSGRYGPVENVSAAGSRTVTALATETTVEKYHAEATVEGRRVPVALHVATIRHEGDLVIAVGAYPRSIDGEAATMRLMRGLRHPV